MSASAPTLPDARSALTGIRVREFSTGWSGAAVAGHLLASQGAEVVAIVDDPSGRPAETRSLDRDKSLRSITELDPARESTTADVVVVDGVWTDRLRTLGVDVAAWRSHPDLVLASVTGWGHANPMPSAELVLQAETGIISVTGPVGGAGTRTGVPMVACSAGLVAYTAIVASLLRRDGGGGGAWLDVAERDVALMTHGNVLPGLLHDGVPPAPAGNVQPVSAPWNRYRAADGEVVIIAITDRLWALLLDVMGQSELADDPRFRSLVDRVVHREAVDALVSEWTATRTTGEVISALRKVDVPAAAVAGIADLLQDPRLRERGVVLRGEAHGARVARAPFEVRASSAGRVPRRVAGAPGRPPLLGIRVVEMGGHTASGLATRLLADLGADVVKAEIGAGDQGRRTAPRLADGSSYLWHFWNVGKRSVHVAPDDPEHRGWFRGIVETADVFVENLAPPTVEALGVDHVTLQAWKPDLVHCSISGYGLVGRDRHRRAFDTVVQAEAGIMSVTGDPGHGPTKTSASVVDNTTALAAAAAIVTALRLQQVSPATGVLVDLALLDVAAWTTARLWPLVDRGAAVTRRGNQDHYQPLEDVHRCRDGRSVAVAATTPEHVDALRALVRAGDENLPELVAHWCAGQDAEEVARTCRDMGIPAGVVRSLDEVVDTDRAGDRPMYVPLDLEPVGTCTVVGSPFRLVDEPDWSTPRRRVPGLGAHQDEVDHELRTRPRASAAAAAGGHQTQTTRPGRDT